MPHIPYQSLTEEQARQIRDACINAAKHGFIQASMQGLCAEGAMEAAISSIQMLDLKRILDQTS